jgi:hypothetical protein
VTVFAEPLTQNGIPRIVEREVQTSKLQPDEPVARARNRLTNETIKQKVEGGSNWGRQNTQSLQAVLAVAPLKKGCNW